MLLAVSSRANVLPSPRQEETVASPCGSRAPSGMKKCLYPHPPWRVALAGSSLWLGDHEAAREHLFINNTKLGGVWQNFEMP